MTHFIYFAFMLLFFGSTRSMELAQIDEGESMLNGIIEGYISKPVNLSRFKGKIWYADHRYQYAFLKDGALPLEKREDVVHCIKTQAERGEAEALCNLGYYYEHINQQPDEAKKYYTLAVEKGLARACYLFDYFARDNREPSLAISEEYMQKAAALGYEPALIRLSFWHAYYDLADSKEYYDKAVALRKAFYKKNEYFLSNYHVDVKVLSAILDGTVVKPQEVLACPYIYDKAALEPMYAGYLVRAGLVECSAVDDIFIRTYLQAHYGDEQEDSLSGEGDEPADACLNLGLLLYKRWKQSKLVDDYNDALRFVNKGTSLFGDYELGQMLLNYKEDYALNEHIILKNIERYNQVRELLKEIGSDDEASIAKELAREYLNRARLYPGARTILEKNGLIKNNMYDVVLSWRTDRAIELNDIIHFIPVIKEFIAAGGIAPYTLFEWFKKISKKSIDKLNAVKKSSKKDKQKQKALKKDIEKYENFQTQCDQWVKEIEALKARREKQQRDAEKRQQKLEKEQQKKLQKLQEKQQQAVSSESVQSGATPPADIKENVSINEMKVPQAVFDSPQISSHASREDRPEEIPVKKEKIKTRPAVTNQPQIDNKSQEKAEPVARPTLIRQMSAVALVRKSSKTDLNDPKYKRLVKRLSCSDLISKVKLDEMDIERTVEELDRRQLIEYRNEKTTLTATSKVNAKTPPLVIHKHGDWASNMDIVKQFLQFVYNVDSEYWQ